MKFCVIHGWPSTLNAWRRPSGLTTPTMTKLQRSSEASRDDPVHLEEVEVADLDAEPAPLANVQQHRLLIEGLVRSDDLWWWRDARSAMLDARADEQIEMHRAVLFCASARGGGVAARGDVRVAVLFLVV